MYTYLIVAIIILILIYVWYNKSAEPFCFNCAPAFKSTDIAYPIANSKRTIGAPTGTCTCRHKHHNRWSIYKEPPLCGKMWETRFPCMKNYRYSYNDLPRYKYGDALTGMARLHQLPLNLRNIWRANIECKSCKVAK